MFEKQTLRLHGRAGSWPTQPTAAASGGSWCSLNNLLVWFANRLKVSGQVSGGPLSGAAAPRLYWNCHLRGQIEIRRSCLSCPHSHHPGLGKLPLCFPTHDMKVTLLQKRCFFRVELPGLNDDGRSRCVHDTQSSDEPCGFNSTRWDLLP